MNYGEKMTVGGLAMALLFATGIDSPKGDTAALWGTIVSLAVALIGIWLMWLDAGRKESIRRTKEIRRIGKIAAEDRTSAITTRSARRGTLHNRDSGTEKEASREVV